MKLANLFALHVLPTNIPEHVLSPAVVPSRDEKCFCFVELNNTCSFAAELSLPSGSVNVNLILEAVSSYDVLSVLIVAVVVVNVSVDAAVDPPYLS